MAAPIDPKDNKLTQTMKMTLFDRISSLYPSQFEETEDGKGWTNIEQPTMQCRSCLSCVRINPVDVAVYGELSDAREPSHWLTLNECRECEAHTAVNMLGEWFPIESVLTSGDSGKQGIKRVGNYAEQLALFTLSQICYPEDDLLLQYDNTSQSSTPCPFLPPGPAEVAKIMWIDGQAIGFYTIKEKASLLNDSPFESYKMPMLDTIYVRKSMRRRGYAERLVADFVQMCEHDDFGICEPLSGSMLKVLRKLLQSSPSLRDRLWACSYTGEEGYRSNIWLNLQVTNNK